MSRLLASSITIFIELLLIFYLAFKAIFLIKEGFSKKGWVLALLLTGLFAISSYHFYYHYIVFREYLNGFVLAISIIFFILPGIVIYLLKPWLNKRPIKQTNKPTENKTTKLTANTQPQLQLSCGKKLFFTLILITSIFLLAEFAARMHIWLLYGNKGWACNFGHAAAISHPYLGLVYKPLNDETKLLVERYNFRCDPDVTIKKPANTYRIVILGGSAAYGLDVGYDACWSKQLQDLLRADFPDKNIQVINTAVAGWTTAECLINLELRALDISPDLVIFFELQNDLKTNRWPNFKSDYSHWKTGMITPGTIEHFFMNYSIFAQRIRTVIHKWGLKRYDSITEGGLNAYIRNITSIIGLCRINNAQILLATYAHNEKAARNATDMQECLTFKGVLEGFTKYNHDVKQLAKRLQVPILDNAKLLSESNYFTDFVHFSTEGNNVVATNFYNKIIQDKLIK